MKAQVGVVDSAEFAVTPTLLGPVGPPVPLLGASEGIRGIQLLGEISSLINATIIFLL